MRLFLPVVAALSCALPCASAASLHRMRVAVRVLSAHEAELTSHYWFQQTAGSTAIDHIAVRFPGQAVRQLEVAADGHALPSRFDPAGAALRLRVHVPPSWEGEYEIRYRVIAEINERMPLMLPDLPPTPADTANYCEFTLELPVDYELLGEPFPRFIRRDTELVATLSDFPGFLFVPARPRQGLTLLDRFLTVDSVTNACLLLFLTGVMVWRLSLKRRPAAGSRS
jgi:hypothetical protein